MKNLVISLEKAKELFKNGSPEIKELLLQTFSDEELNDYLPKTWEDFLANTDGVICYNDFFRDYFDLVGIYPNEKYAKSAKAFWKLTFLMEKYNASVMENSVSVYHTIYYCPLHNKLKTSWEYVSNSLLRFKTYNLAKEFMKNFEDLLKDYFMVD